MEVTEAKNPENKITTLLSIFFISISLFIYQVVLTRLYSVVFSYHYVFLITSLAIFGLGIGSILAYIIRKKAKKAGLDTKASMQSENQENKKAQLFLRSALSQFFL
jgi:hypothetical protein